MCFFSLYFSGWKGYNLKWIITSDPEADVFRIRYSKRHSYVVRRGSNNFEPTEVRCFADAGGNKYKLSDEPRNFYDYNF
jgi:hypothetical protein